MSAIKLLSSQNWIPFFKPVAQAFGDPDPAIILSELANRQQFYEQRGELTEDGFFYVTVETLEDAVQLSKHRQTKAINKLKAKGLLVVEIKGMPAKRHFRFPYDFASKLDNFLTTAWRNFSEQVGKDFTTSENSFIEKTNSIGGDSFESEKSAAGTPPGSGGTPPELPAEEQRIIEALRKAKAYFKQWCDMEKYMLERAKKKPGDVDFYFELENWLRYNSSNLMIMQNPAKKINSDFQRWLNRASSKKPAKNNQPPKINGPDNQNLHKDRQYYGEPDDNETW